MPYPTLPTFTAGTALPAASLTTLKTALGAAPHFKGRINTNTAITANTAIGFTSIKDTESGWTSPNYTIKVAGVYRISTYLATSGALAAGQYLQICKGTSATIIAYPLQSSPAIAANGSFTGTAEYEFAVNDVVLLTVGAGFTAVGSSTADVSVMTIDWLRA